VGSVVFDVADLERGIAFWTAALGYVADADHDDTFCVLRDPHRRRANISMQISENGADRKPLGIHLDLYTEDLAGEVARLGVLGARVDEDIPSDEDHVVMLDPDGNSFCVCGSFRPD
jgi:catechol 2,3-dioxygenase-like lactoylglutathione lyase family enzyme